uniref:Uncharacterized protein n=1 Tax=Anguilla anguilla TaxID=7936 RepID=A0A0E9PIE1_ANGAN
MRNSSKDTHNAISNKSTLRDSSRSFCYGF